MVFKNFTAGLIPQIIAAGQGGENNEQDVSVPGAADHPAVGDVVAPPSTRALPGDGQLGGGFGSPASAWSDSRPLFEQLVVYPATCFLAASFVTVRVLLAVGCFARRCLYNGTCDIGGRAARGYSVCHDYSTREATLGE